ncbi:helix-turn-helix transcriptional regulator [Amycolatopsis sp.]|uniref:PadR family transcriptional regulator n=1 Tax=Amycolatopsis sp. TaxID=37632 RepID=UPI00262D914E|nr:helix-turn-helix transcriptional regulator [Amycolatopsis sp.]
MALLAEEPMHAYRMQQLIKERGVDMVVNVRNRSGLHSALERLVRDGLIQVLAVERDTRHPERTVYELAEQGRDALLAGLRDSVANAAPEFPLFPAVVSFLHLLDSQEVRLQLDKRAEGLRQRLAAARAVITASEEYGVPRLHLLEHEYIQAVTAAELDWVRGVSEDIVAGTLTWKAHV